MFFIRTFAGILFIFSFSLTLLARDVKYLIIVFFFVNNHKIQQGSTYISICVQGSGILLRSPFFQVIKASDSIPSAA